MPTIFVREVRSESTSSRRSLLPLSIAAAIVVAGYLQLPGDLAAKTHTALHGICAQRPSHSLRLGQSFLPLDARMTGMYIAVATAGAWVAATNRTRRTKVPPRGVLGFLALFATIPAVDGINSLAFDLGLPQLYEPSNTLRLATGILGGTTLGVAMAYLVATSIWANPERHRALVERPRELLLPLSLASALGGLCLTGLPILFAPFALGLLVAAILVLATSATMLLALLTDRGWTFRAGSELCWHAAGGVLAALVFMGVLAWLRFFAETRLGLVQLT